jgi:hypothetical protein
LFASGFMYGLLRNHSLQRCCEIGCLSVGLVYHFSRSCYFAVKTHPNDDTRYAPCKQSDDPRECQPCLSGAAVVQVMGAEVSNEGWTWLHAHLHEGRAASLVRG